MARSATPPRPTALSPPASPTPAPAHGAIREIAKNLAGVDLLVFLASEGIGAPLALAGGDAAAHELLRPTLIGFGFGLPLMALGFIFPFIKSRLSEPARERISSIAAFCTTALILSAFIYLVGPAIYQEVVSSSLPGAAAPPATSLPAANAPPPSTPIAPVRIDIVNENFLPITPEHPLAMNFYYVNRSPTIAARGVIDGGKMIISPHLLSIDEEKSIALLYFPNNDFPGPNIANETPPGIANGFYTVSSDIDEDRLKPVLEGKSILYVFTYLKYGDAVSGLMTETEWCAWYSGNLVVAHQCLTFTRVFSRASPKPYLP